jgi:UDP-N-acetylmuramate--alanine ligase
LWIKYDFIYNWRNMETIEFPGILDGLHIHLVGAKGTGMTALAEILHRRGAFLTGSDVADVFYTDSILHSLNIQLFENFKAQHLPRNTDLVIYSAAYSREANPELRAAVQRNIPIFSYPQALGALSLHSRSAGIAGVHGKTTTTALAGLLMEALSMPATVLAGSAISNFNGRCTLIQGNTYFIAETCEYRKHFLNFKPSWIVLTSVESDHQDYFPTYESIRDAFVEYVLTLPAGGVLIFCADQKGAVEVADIVLQKRKDIQFVEYGFLAKGKYKIQDFQISAGKNTFVVGDAPVPIELHVPGRHLVLDAVAAIALADSLFEAETSRTFGAGEWRKIAVALSLFRGSKRRSEIIGEFENILILDDYGHHPTAIKTTIEGIKKFWPHRRLVVDFMSHTYSRTIALQDDFVESLDEADSIVMHKIYSSAREQPIRGFDGRALFQKLCERRPELIPIEIVPASKENASANPKNAPLKPNKGFAAYSEEPMDARDTLLEILQAGDIFLTMGAGDNWKLGKAIAEKLCESHTSQQSKKTEEQHP